MKKILIGLFSAAIIGVASFGIVTAASTSTESVQEQATLQAQHDDTVVHAPVEEVTHEEDSHAAEHFGIVFAMFALVLVAGKFGNFIERWGQPAVIGEIFAGIALSAAGYFGWGFIDETVNNSIIAFIASFGALLLLFSIGLESNIREMKKVGVNALAVALIGVITPFVVGTYVLGPLFYADASSNAKLFLGAALVATSVGITASVFRTLKIIRTRAAQTVLGAAVIDDVLGLIVLSIVSALATGGSVTAGSVALIAIKSFGFLAAALFFGGTVAKIASKFLRKINEGIGMKLTLAIGFALVFGYLAELFGLEPIIGAFAAGLLLDEVHFSHFDDPEIVHDLKALDFKAEKDKTAVLNLIKKNKDTHLEDLVASISLIFVPVFFVYTGMQIDFGSLLQPKLYVVAAVISVVAIATKMLAGIAAKGSSKEKLLVGVSMVPRGEVGLIFAATGKSLGVLSDELFSVIVLVVIITTFIAPPLIKRIGSNLHADKVPA